MGKKIKCGFTLVEVALFLAVTGMLFIGIVAGVRSSMFQQRYNDSVQSFAEFLRTVYSQTINVENDTAYGSGRTDKAIYGKLITFGQKKNFVGENNDNGAVFTYTVIGDAEGAFDTGSVLNGLRESHVSIFLEESDGSYDGKIVSLAGVAEQYVPRWDTEIQTTSGWNDGYEKFKGTILIVRHPNSGVIFTYAVLGEVLEINEILQSLRSPLTAEAPDLIGRLIDEKKFRVGEDIDFCLNPNGSSRSDNRRDIRIVGGARNISGIEIIGMDAGGEGGNRCEK